MTEVSRLQRVQAFIATFRALREAEREARLEAMSDFLATFEAARPLVERRGKDLNLFHLLGLQTDEVSHSAFLAWLFDPQAAHGEGGRFMQVFLGAARPRIPLRLPETYTVRTELSGVKSIIDIAVYRVGMFIVYIENKTVSPDTPGQHDREIRDLRRLGLTLKVPEERQYPVYLTPYGRRALGKYRELWHRVSYRDLSLALSRRLPEIFDERTSLLLDDWLDTTRRFGGVWRQIMNELSEASVLLGSSWPTVLSIQTALDDLL
ncbi:MAG: PD-(D/E)XK nuclease family protein, partial [Anaerolineae bacterium]|nr:PD-(D/E)XK nuclease family protein [Anaerolineae bacterium]